MGQKLVTIRFNMHLPAVISKKNNYYVSNCPVLDIVSQGSTEAEAKKNLAEAITAFMISCHERGVLDAVLKQCGFVPAGIGSAPAENHENFEYIDVPLPFIIDMGNAHRCHA